MNRQQIELSSHENVLILKDLVYHGIPIAELEKEQLLQALQEITATALENKELADKNYKAYESWKKNAEGWQELYYIKVSQYDQLKDLY
jgi:hypothetical protein